jgi:hypothetical protein
MRRRQPSRPGLSYYDANRGRLITEGPDVLNIKAEIESRWPGVLSAFFDAESEEWVIVEKCPDGIERLALKTRVLSMGVIQKLERIDQAKHVQGDVNRKLELEDADVERKKEHALTESIGDGAERLFWALKKDGVIHAPQVFVSAGKKAA